MEFLDSYPPSYRNRLPKTLKLSNSIDGLDGLRRHCFLRGRQRHSVSKTHVIESVGPEIRVDRQPPLGQEAEAMARILRILANPDRLRMLCRMGMAGTSGPPEPTVTELVQLTGLSQSRVSQHLALLRESGVVAPRREGQAVRYRLNDPQVRRVMEALCHLCEPDGAGTIAVIDTGIGMDADGIEVALQPFGQVAQGGMRQQRGTGLGLPIALRLAELHGGTLTIESSLGRGTTVTVALPAAT